MADLVAALESEATFGPQSGAVPPRGLQIANLIAAEGTRLIRLGTRAELARAAVALSTLLAGGSGERLRDEQPRAHRIVSGMSIALKAATAPSSSAGELAVLRSWGGNASATIAELRRASEHKMRRADLRRALGVNESYLSHMLSDLEAASLIVRTREGREVVVHLGAAGRSEHVGRYLKGLEGEESAEARPATGRLAVEELFRSIIEATRRTTSAAVDIARAALGYGTVLEGRRELERQLLALRRRLDHFDASVESTIVGEGVVVCRVRISGVPRVGEGPVEEWRLWLARVEDGQPVKVEGWAPDRVGASLHVEERNLEDRYLHGSFRHVVAFHGSTFHAPDFSFAEDAPSLVVDEPHYRATLSKTLMPLMYASPYRFPDVELEELEDESSDTPLVPLLENIRQVV